VEPISYGKQCEWLRDSYVFYLLNTSTTTLFFLYPLSSQPCPLTSCWGNYAKQYSDSSLENALLMLADQTWLGNYAEKLLPSGGIRSFQWRHSKIETRTTRLIKVWARLVNQKTSIQRVRTSSYALHGIVGSSQAVCQKK